MRVFIFPGQGSQKIGMGLDLFNQFKVAKDVFREVDETLGFNLSKLMFEGDLSELSLTYNTQPALMATGIAVLRVIENELGLKIDKISHFVCGHSLGEFTALCSVGVLTLSETAKILRFRGEAMQKAVPRDEGAMAAFISNNFDRLDDLLKEVSHLGICQIANENSSDQLVISGKAEAVKKAVEISSNFSIRRSILLNVSAPFHCDMMIPARKKIENYLKEINFKLPLLPVICNFTALPETDPTKLKENIISQVNNKVKWKQSVNYLIKKNVKEIVELGTGKVLTGISKRMSNEVDSFSIENCLDIENNLKKFK